MNAPSPFSEPLPFCDLQFAIDEVFPGRLDGEGREFRRHRKVGPQIWLAAVRRYRRMVDDMVECGIVEADAEKRAGKLVRDYLFSKLCHKGVFSETPQDRDALFRQFKDWTDKPLTKDGLGRPVLLDSRGRHAHKTSDLARAIEGLAWFIPAARCFYAASNLADGVGSVPKAVCLTVSLPSLPVQWNASQRKNLLKTLELSSLPICPPDLREAVLARRNRGQPLVPERVAKQIIVNKSIILYRRGPRRWTLDNLSASGSQRRYTNAEGRRVIMQPGDWFGGDDSTPGIAVCVPCNEVITPCSQKFGVLLGRFQWLVYLDCGTDKILAWDYVVRPRGSYRAEDILNGMGTVTHTHGIPRQGWQFEGGTYDSKLVRQAIQLLGCHHWRTYSPHQKCIESVFNRVWTTLAIRFPHADMGRFRNENESNCRLYASCKRGDKDPRKFFPTLDLIVSAFEDEVADHNAHLIKSDQYGKWVPDEYFSQAVGENPLRPGGADLQWVFSPFTAERKIKGALVSCRVPMFEDFSVPFDFNADWMPQFTGKLVRMHFDPRLPRCRAKIVLLENHDGHQAGEVLGDAESIGETAGHIRFIMGYGLDDQQAGYRARQQTAGFMHRVSRGVGVAGRTEYAKVEQRDGLGSVTKLEKTSLPAPPPARDEVSLHRLSSNIAPAESAMTLEVNPISRKRPRGMQDIEINLPARLARMRAGNGESSYDKRLREEIEAQQKRVFNELDEVPCEREERVIDPARLKALEEFERNPLNFVS